jgi:flagellar motility protein MotE (MotC chaperone)
VIFGLLIKMDVGGVGTMLRPLLKNVPVVSMILPDASSDEVAAETGYKYKNLSEAVNRIKELETQLANYQNNDDSSSQKVQELQAEVARLKTFEENQQYYEELKQKFDHDVVYADNAPDISEYKSWYESISPDNAATLYKQVCQDLQYSQEVKDWAETYSKMEPANAASILEEMTGDTNLVAKILLCMNSKQRALVMAEMDTVYAAKLTKIMYP